MTTRNTTARGVAMLVRGVALTAAVLAVVAVFLPGGAARPEPFDVQPVLVGLLVLLAAAACCGRGRAARVAAVLLAVGSLVWAVTLVATDLGTGVPGSATAVLAVAALGVTVAAALGRSLGGAVPVALSVVLLAGASAAAGYVAPTLPVLARTDTAVATPAPEAAQPGAGRWTWSVPGGLRDATPAGPGVAAATWNGEVYGLDGTTGAVRWSYARQGAHVDGLVSTPDGRYVLAAFRPGGDHVTGVGLLVVLDAFSGSVLHERVVDESDVDDTFLVPTSTVLPLFSLIDGEQDNQRIDAVDLRSGGRAWSWTAPRGCSSPFVLPASGRHVVLAPVRCPRSVGLYALRESDGSVLWRHTVPHVSTSDSGYDTFVEATGDGRLVRFDAGVTGPRSDVLLRAADGGYLAGADGYDERDFGATGAVFGRKVTRTTTEPVAVADATGLRRVTRWEPCAGQRAQAVTSRWLVRLCSAGEDASLRWREVAGGRVRSAPVDVPDSGYARLPDLRTARVLAAPGAVVLATARYGDEPGPALQGFATR